MDKYITPKMDVKEFVRESILTASTGGGESTCTDITNIGCTADQDPSGGCIVDLGFGGGSGGSAR